MQALEDCLKSPFDFVKLFGWYWNFHKTNLCTLPLERDAVGSVGETPIEDHVKTEAPETPIENYEVTPPIPHKMCNKTLLLKRNKKNYLILAK